MVLEKTFESPLNCKEIQPVHPKGDQSWVFIGRTDAKYFGHLMRTVDSLEKTLMLGGIGGRRRRGHQRALSPYSHNEKRSCEDTAGRWLSGSQKESPQLSCV